MLNPDLPITKSAEDTLNRSSFAKNLAETILQYSFSSSFTIGLYGKWGSGKTSLLNLTLENIAAMDENAVIIKFNPWLCTDPKQLITQFFKQMATAIKVKKPAGEKVWELVDQFADIFDAAAPIPVVGTFVATLGKVFAKGAKNRIEQRTANLQKSKDQIIEKMKAEKIKIIVSIDDIDRLSEEEIIAVFQLVKALADFPNTVYVLSFDYDVVVQALSKVQHGDGKEYLEKIIQVPFEIPAPCMEDIYNALFSKLNDIIGAIPEERWPMAVWIDFFHFSLKKYIRSLRDVIRYTNVFMLKYELLKDETDPVDLLALTALQVFEPIVYSKIPNYKDILCGSIDNYSHDWQKREEEKVRSTIALLLPKDGSLANFDAALNILGLLFPKIKTDSSISFSMGRNFSRRVFLIYNNVAIPECFDRYFALTLENDAIPTAIIKNLIFEANEEKLSEDIMKLYQNGKIVRFLDELTAYASTETSVTVSDERASMLIKILVRKWGFFDVDDRSFFTIPFNWRLLYCVDPLLKQIDSTARFEFITSVFEDAEVPPATLALLLQDFEEQLGRFKDGASIHENALLKLNEVIELEKVFKKRAVDAIETRAALKRHKDLNFLWLLGKIDEEYVANIKKTLIKDNASLVKIIGYCTSKGVSSVGIDIKTRETNRDTLSGFIDVDEAYRRVKSIINNSEFLLFDEEDQMNTIAFVISMEQTSSVLNGRISEDILIKRLDQLKHSH